MLKKRSCIHLVNSAFILALSLLMGFQSPLWGASAEEERIAKLVEGAKKEGKFVWYTQMGVNESTPILKQFEEKYPFIKGELLRLGLDKLMIKILEERRAGLNRVDVIGLSGFGFHVLKKQGVFQKYPSPQSLSYPEGARDPEGYGSSIYLSPKVIVYNTKLVAPKDAPKTYEDLVDPKWKGAKLVVDTTNYEWFANVLKIRGREKGLELMKRIALQQPQIRTGNSLRSALVAAGEFHAAVPVNGDEVARLKDKGAPVEIASADPTVTLLRPAGIAAQSPHPNSAKLFIDFMLSRQGQEIIRSVGRVPARPDVEPIATKLTRGVKLYYSDDSLADRYNDIVKEYDDLFRRKK